VPGDQKDRKLEVQGVVDIVVVYNDTAAEDDPDGDDSGCTELGTSTRLLLVMGSYGRGEIPGVVT